VLIHHWSHPTTPAGTGWDIVQSNVVRLTTEKGFSARAALGEAEVIRIIVDDLTGIADFKRLHRWYMVEDETDGDQLVWNGYISDQWIDRGEEGDLVHSIGAGRRWELELTQENALLGFRVCWDTDANRPAESPGERLTWLLGSNYLSTVIDHGLIDWTALNARPDMDANDYRPQNAGDVLRHISLITGFNHYARYRDASSDIELAFYSANTSELDTSALLITNDPDDTVDNVTSFRPFFLSPRLHRKGDRVAAGMVVQYKTGFRYDYRLPTSYEFGFIDQVVQDANTTSEAQANRLLARELSQHGEQDERGEQVGIQVPAAALNVVRHGQRFQAKFVEWPGWESYRWVRVISKSFSRPENDTQALYDVELEISPMTELCVIMGYLVGSGENPGTYNVPITNTASGSRTYLSAYGSAGDFVSSDPEGLTFYPHAGLHFRPAPGAGACGSGQGCGGAWFGRNYGFVDATMPTGFADAGALVSPKIEILVVGPGTMTIWLTDCPGGDSAVGSVDLYGITIGNPADPTDDENPDVATLLSSTPVAKPSVTVNVPDDGYCLHRVLVTDTALNNFSVAFGGWDWTADNEP
jgi:hypothetical protein